MAAFEDLVDELERSYREVRERMSDPAVYNDHREAAEVGRRLKELEVPFGLAQDWRATGSDLADARADGDLRELVPELEDRLALLEEQLQLALVEADPADRRDVIVEVRQGVGGDEAALWAGDVYRMLTRYAERRGFKTEGLSASPSDSGGFKEVTFAVKGDGAYSIFKWEGGTHRVQRVPETESQGRIHTSTATVAVMPEAEEVEVGIDANDLKVDVYRSTGPGGQSVNTTDSAVRITHLPTGLVVAMQDEKSQLQNKLKAMRVLRARLLELERAKREAELSAARRSQIGTGERAEKIRTYNFPENRLTDHRIKLTAHQLEKILGGELEEFTQALTDEARRPAGYLDEKGVPDARLDAELLLGSALGLDRIELYADGKRPLTEPELEAFRALVDRRARREPAAYILGEWGFRRLTVRVDRRALIPRPETEVVVERCLALLDGAPAPRVLDVGVGSGAIALAIASEHPGARVVGVDTSDEALALARENAALTGIAVELRHGGFEAAAGGWDLVVSNPPYVSPAEFASLPPEIRDWEPRGALVGEGLHQELARHVRCGWLVLEVGDGQAPTVADALDKLGYSDVKISRDLTERERLVEGRRPC